MNKKHIILVEDEQILADILVARLKVEGYDVTTFTNGKEALSAIIEIKPDLVLLDIMLPGTGGFEILKELNAKHVLPSLPIIIISNSGQPVEIERAQKLGIRDYLVKVNFTPQEVVEKVKQVFDPQNNIKATEEKLEKHSDRAQILIIEDDTIIADSLERKFAQKKYVAYKAINGREAKRILAEKKIALILLDLILPDVDGFDFLGELKKDPQLKDIPVVIISNLGQQEEIKRGISAGAVDYLIKANTVPEEIFKKVEAVLQKINIYNN